MKVRPKLFVLLPLLAFACCGPEPATTIDIATPAQEQPKATDTNMSADADTPATSDQDTPPTKAHKHELATFGGGCFWCTEAVLEQLDGVVDVESGYTGGVVDNPTYEQICGGRTEHAEVVKVTFDPKVISYETLLDWFFRSHDPTTLNRQGNDVGTQYRSAIFFHSEEQQKTALSFIDKIANNWSDPIVTELTPAVKFWPAEPYHQDYYRNNPRQGYCSVIIRPKLAKLGLDTAPKK